MLRIVDLTLSILGIVLLSPVMFLLLLTGWRAFGAPLFFQRRVGKDQRLFTLVKFRSLPLSTPDLPTHMISQNSVSPYGSWLRRNKLDELPQLFCVLIGSMSLVGPRPCLESQFDLIKYRAQRSVLKVRPGITGLSQIHGVDMSKPLKLARIDALMCRSLNICFYFALLVSTVTGSGHGDRTSRDTNETKT